MDSQSLNNRNDLAAGAVEQPAASRPAVQSMSYKFQRLREKIRAAVESGELHGKLPGERALARRFHVNAKTLSKALTDLAAEGLLDRSIGRGTYVKGSAPAGSEKGRWLVIADADDTDASLINALRSANADLHVATDLANMRPSFLNQFSAVIDSASNTPEAFLRDLVVRNIPVVAVNHEPKTYSMHCVLLDTALGVNRLGRDLALAGHRRFAAVEPRGSNGITTSLRQTVARYAVDSVVDTCSSDEVTTLVENGVTAIVCGSCPAASAVKARLERAAIRVPGQVSIAAVGCIAEGAPVSGYFCSTGQLAEAVVGLLSDHSATRPSTLWLAGAWQDLGTTGPSAAMPGESPARMQVSGVLV